jgi:hypothetical protein
MAVIGIAALTFAHCLLPILTTRQATGVQFGESEFNKSQKVNSSNFYFDLKPN